MGTDMNTPSNEPWHLDKKVPISLILAIIVQSAVVMWWAARIDANDSEQERRIAAIESWRDGTQQQLQSVNERLARIDERIAIQTDMLKEIKNRVGGGR